MIKKILIILLYGVFVLSTLSIILILSYIDPYTTNNLVRTSLIISLVLSLSSILTVIFYFIKKVHYRGEVLTSHLSASVRQSLLVAGFFLGMGVFLRLGVPFIISSALLLVLLIFFELLIQSIISQ